MSKRYSRHHHRTIQDRFITRNRITKQLDGPEPVFIINGPPEDACCNICGRSAEELEPFDQEFVKARKELEEFISRDTPNGYFFSPYLTAENKLTKTFRYYDGIYIEPSWECQDCYPYFGQEVTVQQLSRYYH